MVEKDRSWQLFKVSIIFAGAAICRYLFNFFVGILLTLDEFGRGTRSFWTIFRCSHRIILAAWIISALVGMVVRKKPLGVNICIAAGIANIGLIAGYNLIWVVYGTYFGVVATILLILADLAIPALFTITAYQLRRVYKLQS